MSELGPQKRRLSSAEILAKLEVTAVQWTHLLPCPFCGGEAVPCYQRDDLGDWKVECTGCGAVSCPDGMRYDRDLAIADWNKRA
jgi:Lar family restriction alleviation protein